MALPIRQQASFICIRECFTYNRRFRPGEPFPENWLSNGYTPNHHFAPAAEAHDALRRARDEKLKFGHGDDPRSTAELTAELEKYMKINAAWDRKKIWLELTRHENAAAKDGKKKTG